MDVILHVGAHRTATTSFQAYLRRNQMALADLRIAVWEPERMRGGLANGLTGRAGPLTPQMMKKAQRSTGLMRLEIERLRRAGMDRLLVSEENMIGSLRDNLQSTSLYAQAVPRLARFVGAFGAHCARVVIGIRSYDSYWASALAYALPGGTAMPDAARLDRFVTQPRRWRRLIEEVANSFPRAECLVVPFEAVAGRPEVQLAAMMGEPVPELADARRWLHPSPGRDMLRQALIDRGARGDAARIPQGDGRWQPFAPGHVEVMQAQYAEDMDWLQAGAGGFATLMVDQAANAVARSPSKAGYRERYDDGCAIAGAGTG